MKTPNSLLNVNKNWKQKVFINVVDVIPDPNYLSKWLFLFFFMQNQFARLVTNASWLLLWRDEKWSAADMADSCIFLVAFYFYTKIHEEHEKINATVFVHFTNFWNYCAKKWEKQLSIELAINSDLSFFSKKNNEVQQLYVMHI